MLSDGFKSELTKPAKVLNMKSIEWNPYSKRGHHNDRAKWPLASLSGLRIVSRLKGHLKRPKDRLKDFEV